MKNSERLFLQRLKIHNLATFENQDVTFDSKFNAIIGETGSGKSLMLDALQLVFGHRADKKLVRKNTPFAMVEASFFTESPKLLQYFNEIGYPVENSEIVIKRIIYPIESSRSFLNFQSCSLQTLVNFSRKFIDLVGQFENQKLLGEEYQLNLLDTFCSLQPEIKEYVQFFSKLQKLRKDLKSAKQGHEEKLLREDYLRFQINEIEAVNPSDEDEKALNGIKEKIINSERRNELIGNVLNGLSENDNFNVIGILKKNIDQLKSESSFCDDLIIDKLSEVYHSVEDISYQLSRSLDDSIQGENADGNLDSIVDRLDKYQKLKGKFGGTTISVVDHLKEFNKELMELDNCQERTRDLVSQVTKQEEKCKKLALFLHKRRVEQAQILSKELTKSVRQLKMDGATMKIEVNLQEKFGPTGISKLEFVAETNPGEGYHPVKDIASGGELSRILLSMRKILSSNDSISVFLFDEVDSGIGGETALRIGQALKRVASESQVIAITHLPQIANFASKLINVTKHLVINDEVAGVKGEKRTVSRIQEVVEVNREKHIRAMSPLQ